jgi:AcrR family transcriptional regulator
LTASEKVSIVYFVPASSSKPAKARKKAARSYHHGDLAQALRDAALEAIAKDGPEKLNLRDLARKLGVSPAAPYRHYADKDALLRAIGADIAVRFSAEVERARAEAAPDAISQFRAIGIANVRFAVRNPAHFRVLYMPGIVDEQAAAQTAEERAMLVAAQARGELVDLPVEDIALAAGSLVYGLSRLIVDGLLPGPRVTAARADALATAVTNVFGLGIVPRPRDC